MCVMNLLWQKYMPVLDDPIQPSEVELAMKQLKVNKASGIDGLSPGLLKYVPINWILLLCTLLNHVFNGEYISTWLTAKLVTIYKKDNRRMPCNYRCISTICALANLYMTLFF